MTAKERLAIPPQEMRELSPLERAHTLEEVALGLTAEQAKLEASRCLNCPARPCVQGCPVKIRIPDFLAAAAAGDFAQALAIIRENSLLPAVCGRVCPQERQCQKFCTVGKLFKDVQKAVAIGRVERFVADCAQPNQSQNFDTANPQYLKSQISNFKLPLPLSPTPTPATTTSTFSRFAPRVAVIGSGPASITCAADLSRAGFKVTMFEAFHEPGGVLLYGIPEFRLPKRIVRQEIDNLKAMGVEIVCDFVVGRTRTIDDLRGEFAAVFIGTGAGLPKFMGIEGEDLVGVFSANEYLTRANLMKAYREDKAATPYWHGKKVAVLGGGNVAMDSARMALRLGAQEVHLVYRRSEQEMPARAEEVAHAKAEGVVFHTLENVKRILGDDEGRVRAVECLKYELGECDASGRRSPVAIEGSEFERTVDTVIVAVGSGANPLIADTTPSLKTDAKGHVIVDEETMMTSIPGVFAGGDIVLGAATVILAMGEGRKAAAGIRKYLC